MTYPEQEPGLPTIEAVASAYLDLQQHNHRHTGLGSVMFNTLQGIFEAGEIVTIDSSSVTPNVIGVEQETEVVDTKETADYTEEHIKESLKDGEMSQDIVGFTGDPIFDAVGLIRTDGAYWGTADGQKASNARQTLRISRQDNFVDFLGRADGKLGAHEGLGGMLAGIYENLLRDIEASTQPIAHIDEQDRDLIQRELLSNLAAIQPLYGKFASSENLSISLEKGNAYLSWGEQPEFSDYITARKLGLDEEFMASRWHLDMPTDTYLSYWTMLLAHYDEVSDKWGDDSNLVLLMSGQIQDAIATASSWLGDNDYPAEYVSGIKPIIERLNKTVLSRFSS